MLTFMTIIILWKYSAHDPLGADPRHRAYWRVYTRKELVRTITIIDRVERWTEHVLKQFLLEGFQSVTLSCLYEEEQK